MTLLSETPLPYKQTHTVSQRESKTDNMNKQHLARAANSTIDVLMYNTLAFVPCTQTQFPH